MYGLHEQNGSWRCEVSKILVLFKFVLTKVGAVTSLRDITLYGFCDMFVLTQKTHFFAYMRMLRPEELGFHSRYVSDLSWK